MALLAGPARLLLIHALPPGWIGYRPMHTMITAKKQMPMLSSILGARGKRMAKPIIRHVYMRV